MFKHYSKNPYGLALLLAILMHVLVLAAITLSVDSSPSIKPALAGQAVPIHTHAVDARVIQAEVVKIKQARQARLQHTRNAQRQLRQLQRQQMQAQRHLRKQQQRRLTMQRIQKREQKRLAKLQHARQDAMRAEQARKQKQIRMQKRAKEAQALLANQLATEEKSLAVKRTGQVRNIVAHYMALIQASVENNWVKPSQVASKRHCKLLVRLLPNGQLVSVGIVKSSGDAAFDRSAISAVYKAQPLPIPSAPDIFDHYFRKFTITT